MGSRHVGELLLRPLSSARFLTSTPSISIKPIIPQWSPASCCRQLSNSSTPRAAQPQLKVETQEPASTDADTLGSQLDSLFAGTPVAPLGRTSARSKTPASSRTQEGSLFGASSSPRQRFGERFSPGKPGGARPRLDWESMLTPPTQDGHVGMQQTPNKGTTLPEGPEHYPRLNASTGRTVDLDPSKGRDIVRGLAMLGALISRNKVRADFQKQRFHERPGLKRKRLKSQRWRARFKSGFDGVCGRVSELTRKGW